jgi:hypothetical protein
VSADSFEEWLEKSPDFQFPSFEGDADARERKRLILEARLRQQMEMTAALDRAPSSGQRFSEIMSRFFSGILEFDPDSPPPSRHSLKEYLLPRVRHVYFGSEHFYYVRFRKNVAFIKNYGFRAHESDDEIDSLAIALNDEVTYRKAINRAVISGAKLGRSLRHGSGPAKTLEQLARLLRSHSKGLNELSDLYLPSTRRKPYSTVKRPADVCAMFAEKPTVAAAIKDPQHVIDAVYALSCLLANVLTSNFGGHGINYGFNLYFIRTDFNLRLMDLADDIDLDEVDIGRADNLARSIKMLLRQRQEDKLHNIEIEANKRYYRNFSSALAIISQRDGSSYFTDTKSLFDDIVADLTALDLRLQTVHNRLFAINSYLDYTDKQFKFAQYQIFSDALDDARAFDASAVQPRFVEYLNGINRDGTFERQATRLRQRLQIHNDIRARSEAHRKEKRSVSFNAIVTFFAIFGVLCTFYTLLLTELTLKDATPPSIAIMKLMLGSNGALVLFLIFAFAFAVGYTIYMNAME